MALFADGKSDEALSIDKELLTETPDQSEENLLAGEILVRNHHFGDAEAYLTKIRDTGQKFMPRVHALWEKCTLRQIGFLRLYMSSKWGRSAMMMAVFTIS